MKIRFIIMGVFMLSQAQACEKTQLVIDEASVELLVTPINLGISHSAPSHISHNAPSHDPIIVLFEGALSTPFYQQVIGSIKIDLKNIIQGVDVFKGSKKKSKSKQTASDEHVAGYVEQIEKICKIFQSILTNYDDKNKSENLLNIDCVLGGWWLLNQFLAQNAQEGLGLNIKYIQAIFRDLNNLQKSLQDSILIKIHSPKFLKNTFNVVKTPLSLYNTPEALAKMLEFETLFQTYQKQSNEIPSSNLIVKSIRKLQLDYTLCRDFHELMMAVALAKKPFLQEKDLVPFVNWGMAMVAHQEETILKSLCKSQNRSIFKIELQGIEDFKRLQMALGSLKGSKIIYEQEAKNENTKETESSSSEDTDSTIIMEDLEEPSPKTDGMQSASETPDAAETEMTDEQGNSVDSDGQNLENDSRQASQDPEKKGVTVNATTHNTTERALVRSSPHEGDQRSTIPTSLTDKLSNKMRKLVHKLETSKLFNMGVKQSLQVLAKLGITIETQNGGSHDKMTNGRSIVRGHGGDKKNKLSWLSAKLLKKLLAERINTENTDLTTVKEQKNQIKNAKKTEKK